MNEKELKTEIKTLNEQKNEIVQKRDLSQKKFEEITRQFKREFDAYTIRIIQLEGTLNYLNGKLRELLQAKEKSTPNQKKDVKSENAE